MKEVKQARNLKVIVSGGGTGGHIFPAIAIADELKRRLPDTEFLFVGAEGKMEMEKVPKAGYRIVGLPIRGLQRRLTWANLSFPFRLLSSLWQSRKLIKEFKPDLVIGTGGYAGGPILYAAAKAGIPTLIQEPNAFAGLANKWVGRYVDVICVAFEGMRKYFPKGEIVITGNPVRETLLDQVFDYQKPARPDVVGRGSKVSSSSAEQNVLLMGGSGGAKSLNEALAASTELIASQPDINWTWQCGKFYYEQFRDCATAQLPNVTITAFLDRMDEAYANADLVIGRAGSTTIAEIEYLGKPIILVPSPWVTEDHQTKNAEALVKNDAGLLLPDAEAKEKLVSTVFELLANEDRLKQIGQNAKAQAKPGAVGRIVEEALALVSPLRPQRGNPQTVPPLGAEGAFDHLEQVYFIGIGGIGMSALARYFNSRGIKVSGYDRTETELTRTLVNEGIEVHYEADVEEVPGLSNHPTIQSSNHPILYIYTPAVPATFPELVALREAGKELYKRSQVLGMISRDQRCVAIAGTHGKTTTTTLTTHLMRECGVDVSAFLGGIARNFGTNYVHGKSDWVVVEADEYDRSFLQLHPELAVILSTDADHLDIYGDHETMLESGFGAFAKQVDKTGLLLVRHGLTGRYINEVNTAVRFFGLNGGDCRAENIRVEDGMFTFDYHSQDTDPLLGLKLPLPGRHNVENAVAAIALTITAGGDARKIESALASFKGIARRFETVVKNDDLVVIDDYAHHPTELTAAIGAAKELYPNRKITGVFQPHLYSRTQDFADGFATALDLLDEVIMLPIYPAREEAIPGVSSQMLLDRMQNENKKLVPKNELTQRLATNRPEVLLMLGAGDIDALVKPLAEQLTTKKPSL